MTTCIKCDKHSCGACVEKSLVPTCVVCKNTFCDRTCAEKGGNFCDFCDAFVCRGKCEETVSLYSCDRCEAIACEKCFVNGELPKCVESKDIPGCQLRLCCSCRACDDCIDSDDCSDCRECSDCSECIECIECECWKMENSSLFSSWLVCHACTSCWCVDCALKGGANTNVNVCVKCDKNTCAVAWRGREGTT